MTDNTDTKAREFSSSNESRQAADTAPDSGYAKAKAQAKPCGAQLPEINFATFIMSLNASALVHLGIMRDPATDTKSANFPLAKQTIDILAMLEQKTVGNLAEDEKRLLSNLIYELRILYVKQKKQAG